MSYLGNVLKFEMFNGKNMLKNAWEHPDQMLLGAADPFSARVWSTITGKDYKPIVDQMGGATQDTYRKADAAGIDTHDGRQVQNLAHVIAGLYAGGYGANAAGVGSAGGVGGSGILSSAAPAAAPAATTTTATTAAPAASSGGLFTMDNAAKGMTMAQQAGLFGGQQQPVQSQPLQNRAPDFSGLLSADTQLAVQRAQEDQQRKLAAQNAVRGLLSYGG